MTKKFSTVLISSFLFWTCQIVVAQSSILDLEGSKVSVKGGSTLHNWEAKASNFGVHPENISFASGNEIDSLYFYVEVSSLDGGRGSTMNKKIYNAFNADENPLIEYKLQAPIKVNSLETEGVVEMVSNGELKMAGVVKDIEIKVRGEMKDEKLVLTGTKDMKMSDFGIEPPSAMFGQIVCDDEITVIFELSYKTSQ